MGAAGRKEEEEEREEEEEMTTLEFQGQDDLSRLHRR